jgi:aminoglycoside phosphotransferase (APT) family kinase protein
VSASSVEVDADRLRGWLRTSVPALGVGDTTPVSVERVGGGYSNLTFRVTLGTGDAALALILRRGPVGVRADRGAHDMRREFRVLMAVHGSTVPVPAPLALCEDESVLGGMFFLMSLIPGVAVRRLEDAPALRDPAVMRRMSEACIDALADLHALPVVQMPLYDASRVADYGARQLANWQRRWGAARPADVPDAEAAMVFRGAAQRLEVRQSAGGAGGSREHSRCAGLGDGHNR